MVTRYQIIYNHSYKKFFHRIYILGYYKLLLFNICNQYFYLLTLKLYLVDLLFAIFYIILNFIQKNYNQIIYLIIFI